MYHNIIKSYSPIGNENLLKSYALDILNGLNDIHRSNIIHCDIKPHNFIIFESEDKDIDMNVSDCSYDPNVVVKISDFGLSHLISNGSNKAYLKYKCGTHSYTAPEVINVIILT
jgi:serine/threonine protein kinase